MADAIWLQDWTTLTPATAQGSVTHDASGWLDVSGYQGVAVPCEIAQRAAFVDLRHLERRPAEQPAEQGHPPNTPLARCPTVEGQQPGAGSRGKRAMADALCLTDWITMDLPWNG